MNYKKFNIWTSDQIAPPSELDCTDDYYEVADAQLDHNYLNEKIVQALMGMSKRNTTQVQIIYGGVVSDAGSGNVNISEGLALAKDKDSSEAILLRLPALSNVSIPSGWNDNRLIYIVGKYTTKTTGSTRAHYEGTSYYFQVVDSYLGESSRDDLFTDSNPGASTQVIWDSFKMNVTTFSRQTTRSYCYSLSSVVTPPPPGNIAGSILPSLSGSGTAPDISPGSYEVDGMNVIISSRLLSSIDGYIGETTRRNDYWYYVLLNSEGRAKLQLAEGGYIGKTYPITSISGGNTINFTGIAGGTQPVAGMIIAIEGATTSDNNGLWTVASVGGSPVTSIVTNATLTDQAGAAGTVKVYYRMSTYHKGAGSEVGITTAAQTEWYTPSPADDLFATPVVRDWAWFDSAKNGYYSKWSGYTEYRIIGVFYNAATYNCCNFITYKSGRNKNDNLFQGPAGDNTYVAYSGVNVARLNYIGVLAGRYWGNDWVAADDGTYGGSITLLRPGKVFGGADIAMRVDQTNKQCILLCSIYTSHTAHTEVDALSGPLNEVGTLASLVTRIIVSIDFKYICDASRLTALKFIHSTLGTSGYPKVDTLNIIYEVQ